MTTPPPSVPRPRVVPLGRRASVLLAIASAVGVVAFAWPFLGDPAGSQNLAHATDAPWIFVALVPLLVAIIFAELADGSLDSKAIALLGVLAACGAALRLPGGVGGFEPVLFLLIPAGRVLGRGFGFVLGAVTLFASAVITGGVGPWLPFQMIGAAWVGFGAGCLPRCGGRRELVMLAGYGMAAGLAYGALMNLWFWPFGSSGGTAISYDPSATAGENLHSYVVFYLTTSLGWDLLRSTGLVASVLVMAPAVLAALHRVSRRAAFGAPVQFNASDERSEVKN